MLFRTVYGPELLAIYQYITDCNPCDAPPTKNRIHRAFLMNKKSSQSIDDALAFLLSAGLISEQETGFVPSNPSRKPFRIELLRRLRQLERGERSPRHPLDPLYTLLLTRLFVESNILYIEDVHAVANQLDAVEAVGGLSKEKIRAWERVMAYLGIGHRVSGGFLCTYEPTLLIEILQDWREGQGTLQDFLEHLLGEVLPYAQISGDLVSAIKQPLLHLKTTNQIELFPMQDSPTRAYFGPPRYKGLAFGGHDA
jgi:hypothetical protein